MHCIPSAYKLIFCRALMYRCFNFWSSLNVKNTQKPTYNSPITGDFGRPALWLHMTRMKRLDKEAGQLPPPGLL
jgi:hypothetical protein